MKLKVYEYNTCSTCKKALKYLDLHKANYEKIDIVQNPPSTSELKKMLTFVKLQGGSIKNILNTSGVFYREMKIAEKIKDGLSENNLIELLSQNGKLIKRPFILADNTGLVGFKEDQLNSLIEQIK